LELVFTHTIPADGGVCAVAVSWLLVALLFVFASVLGAELSGLLAGAAAGSLLLLAASDSLLFLRLFLVLLVLSVLAVALPAEADWVSLDASFAFFDFLVFFVLVVVLALWLCVSCACSAQGVIAPISNTANTTIKSLSRGLRFMESLLEVSICSPPRRLLQFPVNAMRRRDRHT
jgi:hypothetical protein